MSADDDRELAPISQRIYTVRGEYEAQGAGVEVRVLVVAAAGSGGALTRFRAQFDAQVSDATWAYLRRGVNVHEGLHRSWLAPLLAPRLIDALERDGTRSRLVAVEWAYNAS